MRKLLMVVVMMSSWTACAVTADEADPATGEREQAISEIFRETWDNLNVGNVDGQNGWVGNCTVFPDENSKTNKYLKCVGGNGATKSIGFHGAGSYISLVDIGPNNNVVNSTHGKFTFEGPQGRAFQILVGCDNIRVAFQMSGPSAVLASFPCQSQFGPPSHRVVCSWSTGGTVLSCGAAALPNDPTTFVNLPLPSGMRPFDRLAIETFPLPGATLVDKIYIWQN
jgi:hypothetical protein